MRRRVWVIRHAHSQANIRSRYVALGKRNARLTGEGRKKARQTSRLFPTKYGITPHNTPVAVSQLRRTQQTAEVLGFKKMKSYPQLNEVELGLRPGETHRLLANHDLPDIVIEAAEKLLRKPPPEQVWVTHGLLVAGLCAIRRTLIQLPREEVPVPFTCEVRLVEI